MRIVRAAPAKLNLYLHVVGRRPDGYHLLDGLVAFADIADEIVAEPADTLGIKITGPYAFALDGLDADNLVTRSAKRLASILGRSPGAALTLVKNLPVASGIGGGSADAAATLEALLALWQAELPPEHLAALAAELGADVPVCLVGRTSWLGGIGEHVDPAPPLPAVGVVLVNPNRPLPTPAVFKARRGAFSKADRFDGTAADAGALATLLASRRNDLTAAAVALVPEIADVLAALGATEGALLVRMSGSGATCFGLYADDVVAKTAAEQLRRDAPGWWVAAGRLMRAEDERVCRPPPPARSAPT